MEPKIKCRTATRIYTNNGNEVLTAMREGMPEPSRTALSSLVLDFEGLAIVWEKVMCEDEYGTIFEAWCHSQSGDVYL